MTTPANPNAPTNKEIFAALAELGTTFTGNFDQLDSQINSANSTLDDVSKAARSTPAPSSSIPPWGYALAAAAAFYAFKKFFK
jgi:hypothetical protein